MTEKQFENKVKQFLKEKGCWILKTWSNGVQRDGVPDLLICCNGLFIGVELKAKNGKPSKLQLWNVNGIRDAGGIAIVLYPDQFDQFKRMIELLISGNPNSYKIQYVFDRKEKDETDRSTNSRN